MGDVLNFSSDVGVLDGTDNFNSRDSIQTHGSRRNLSLLSPTEVVRVTSGVVPNFNDRESLNGVSLLAAIGGTITVQANGNEHLFAVADVNGDVGVYFGDAGSNNRIVASELALVAVLQGSDVRIGDLVYQNFANDP